MELDDILLEIFNKFIDGEKVNIEEYCKKYPQYKDSILSKLRIAEFIRKDLKEEDLSGKKLGEYTILQELGRGGMGIVFLGIHPALSRLTAIKVLPPTFAQDKEALQNFQEEAKTIAKFNHPNIVPIYSISNEEGMYYIAMGYIAGPSFNNIIVNLQENKQPHLLKANVIRKILQMPPLEKQHITQKSIALKRNIKFWEKTYYQFVATIGAEVADALYYAHQNHIIHGDIKPSNIMLTTEGIPMVVDFGLSKDIKKLCASKTNEFTGTLAYAAPEQIKEGIVSEKTDIWSLGVTLYELLTLRNPFIGETVKDVVTKILNGNPLPLKTLNKNIPLELEAVILKCLESKPENRYNSISELCKDLNNYLESKPTKAKPLNILGRAKKFRKRHPVLTNFISIFIFIATMASYIAYSININNLAEKGREFQNEGKAKEAENLYLKVIKLALPIPPMKRSIEKVSEGLGALYKFGKYGFNQQEKALGFYKKCVSMNPNNSYCLSEIGHYYKDNKNYDEALKYFEQIYKRSTQGLYVENYPELLLEMGKADKAVECYTHLLEVKDSFTFPFFKNFSRALAKLGRGRNELIKYYQIALEKDSTNINLLGSYTDLLKLRGEEAKAIKYYEIAVKNEPKNNYLLKKYGDFLGQTGGAEEAIEYYKRSLEIDPFGTVSLKKCSELLRQLSRENEALDLLAKYCKNKEVADTIFIQGEIVENLINMIKRSTYFKTYDDGTFSPTKTFDKIVEFLVSKGFDKEYVERTIKKDSTRIGYFISKGPE